MNLSMLPLRCGQRLRFSVILLLSSLLGLAATAADNGKKSFDLPAGPAGTSLKNFARQAGREIVFAVEAVGTVATNPVKGDLTPQEALDRLLADTGLVATLDAKTGAFAVRPGSDPNAERAARPIPSDRPATMVESKQPSRNDEVLELSPFVVNAEQDTGYRASGTLAGTRLRTELRDVAASVTAVTKDFMNDINAVNLEGVLVYTTGTEVSGLGGNFSDADIGADRADFDQTNRSPNSGTRVRGLTRADTTRDFFLTDIPLDGYNTDRVEISRGPNAMLFGLGSPAGIINSNLIKARLDRNKGQVEFKYGSNDTHRETLDYNHVLIEDKLAVRIAGLTGEEKYRQNFSFIKDKRGFATATWKPFTNTTIRTHGEWARQDSNKVRTNPPFDTYSWWWQIGQPTYDPSTGLVTLTGPAPSNPALNPRNSNGSPNGNVIRPQIGSWNQAVGLIVEDPSVRAFGITGMPGVQAMEGGNERVRLTSSGAYATDRMQGLRDSKQFLQFINGGSADPRFAFWRDTQITDPAIFDFYHERIDGPNNYEWAKWQTFNVTLEQRLLDGAAGFELAYDRQDQDSGFLNMYSGSSYAIYLDINSKLQNGVANPNVGRPVIASSGWTSSGTDDREAKRATAYYELDFPKYGDSWLHKLLGRQTFTGTYTDQEAFSERFAGRSLLMGLDHYLSEAATFSGTLANDATNSRRYLIPVTYVGSSVIGTSDPQGIIGPGLTVDIYPRDLRSVNTLYYQSPLASTSPRVLAPWQVKPFSIITNEREDTRNGTGSFTVERTRDTFKSAVLVLQSRWWENTVVSTVGWRRDSFVTRDAGTAAFDPATGLRIISPDVWFPRVNLDDSQTSFNYGVVVHAPKQVRRRLPEGMDVSLIYNTADNFRPTAQRLNLFGAPIDAETGDTKEYGALVSLFSGKFELRATHYETASALATNSSLTNTKNRLVREIETFFESNNAGNNAALPAALAAWNTWVQSPVAQNIFETFNFVFTKNPDGSIASSTHDDRVGVVVATSDLVSTGWEFEAVINPTRNWRIALNAARQEAVRSNTGQDFQALLAALEPTFTGPAGALRRSASGATLAEFYATNSAELNKEVLLDGSPTPELRKWRWNAVTNYTFDSGRLKGWNVGGAVRWQDKAAIGFPVIVVGSGPQIDVKKPYFGPAETNYDAWVGYSRKILRKKIGWRVQLNVKNLGVGNEMIPVSAQPDGSISAWRITQPETWTLTNTFDF